MTMRAAAPTMLGMATLIYVVNMLDRQIMGIVLPAIRREFALSDTMLGLLAGPSFAVIYALAGIPLALLADRGNRRAVVAASLGVFSLATMACGAASGFVQLVAARFVTGIGEAGTTPALNSMLSDLYPPQRRARVLAFFTCGANIGLLLAFFGGGLIVQHWGWRAAFLAAGIPGLLLLPVFLAATREPARTHTPSRAGMMATVKLLWRQPAFRMIALATALVSINGYAGSAFAASFLARSHGIPLSLVGMIVAGCAGLLGFAGNVTAGLLAGRDGAGARTSMRIGLFSTIIALPFQLVFYLAPPLWLCVAGLAVLTFCLTMYLGPAMAVVQNLAPPAMRAQAAALLLLVLNLVGMGVGPQLAGFLSDLMTPRFGEDALRYALALGILPCALAALCFARAARILAKPAV